MDALLFTLLTLVDQGYLDIFNTEISWPVVETLRKLTFVLNNTKLEDTKKAKIKDICEILTEMKKLGMAWTKDYGVINENGDTVLHIASSYNCGLPYNYDIVEKLVEFFVKEGLDIDAKNNVGKTALMESVWWTKARMFKLLLKLNADISIKDNLNRTAYNLAEKRWNIDAMYSLRK